MTASPLVLAVQNRLRNSGFIEIPTPFRMAGVQFEFTAAMRGQEGRALDLILLVDTTAGDYGDTDAERVRHRIEALSRALDVTGSRYVVTAILIGASLVADIEQLSETCRVLYVEPLPTAGDGTLANNKAKDQLDDRIRVLLPLFLPDRTGETERRGTAIEQLEASFADDADHGLLDALMEASKIGEDAVTQAAATTLSRILLEAKTEPT